MTVRWVNEKETGYRPKKKKDTFKPAAMVEELLKSKYRDPKSKITSYNAKFSTKPMTSVVLIEMVMTEGGLGEVFISVQGPCPYEKRVARK